MTAGRDDDALTWDGDEDPTLDVGASRESAPALPEGFTAVGRGAETVGRGAEAIDGDGEQPSAEREEASKPADSPAPRGGHGSAGLIALGALGGIYLLLSVGWLIGAGRLQLIAQLFLDPVAFTITVVLAALAPVLWFGTTVLLTRDSRPAIRFGALALGALLLIPWPFVIAGAAL